MSYTKRETSGELTDTYRKMILPAPVDTETVNQVVSLFVHNRDTKSHTITVEKQISESEDIFRRVLGTPITLEAGDTASMDIGEAVLLSSAMEGLTLKTDDDPTDFESGPVYDMAYTEEKQTGVT